MTLTLVATASSASANAFCTLAEAEAYMETLVYATAWSNKTDQQKIAALITSARWMNTLKWKGVRGSQAQSMAWPRCAGGWTVNLGGFTPNANGYLLDQDGYQVAADAVPTCVKNANAQAALDFMTKDRAADPKMPLKLGTLEITPAPRMLMSAAFYDLVRHFLASSPGQVLVQRS